MKKNYALAALVVILLAAFFMRQYRLDAPPFFGDEVDDGDIALDILHGHIAPFYPQGDGREPLFQYTMAVAFFFLGDSMIANRWTSVAWGMVFVALMYSYARTLFTSHRAGVLAAGLTAVLWYPVVFARLGIRDGAVPVVMVPALLGLWIALKTQSPRRAWQAAILGGVAAALPAYTFTSGRGFPAIIALFLAYLALAHKDLFRSRWRAFAAYFGVMILASLPLYAHLYLHPDQDARTQALAGLSWWSQRDLNQMIAQIVVTLGMFSFTGDTNWLWAVPGTPIFIGAFGLFFYAGILICLIRWRKPEYALQLIALALMLVPTIVTERPPNWGRSTAILPAMLTIAILPLAWGWVKIADYGRDKMRRAVTAYGTLVALLGIALFVRTADDMFNGWLNNPGIYWMSFAFYYETADYVNRSPDTTPLNYVMDFYNGWRKRNLQRPIQRRDVAVRWSVTNAFVFPDDPRGARIAFQIFGDPARPLQFTFLDLDHPIYIDPRVDPAGNRPLRIYYVPRALLDEHLARAKNGAIFLPGSNARVESFQVGDSLQFLGYEILNPNTNRGEEMNMLTYWRALRRPPEMAIFLHLIHPNGDVVAQYDGFDVVAEDLKSEDIVVQLHALELPSNLPDATYRFEIGAYARADLKRIPLSTGGDYLWLETWSPQ